VLGLRAVRRLRRHRAAPRRRQIAPAHQRQPEYAAAAQQRVPRGETGVAGVEAHARFVLFVRNGRDRHVQLRPPQRGECEHQPAERLSHDRPREHGCGLADCKQERRVDAHVELLHAVAQAARARIQHVGVAVPEAHHSRSQHAQKRQHAQEQQRRPAHALMQVHVTLERHRREQQAPRETQYRPPGRVQRMPPVVREVEQPHRRERLECRERGVERRVPLLFDGPQRAHHQGHAAREHDVGVHCFRACQGLWAARPSAERAFCKRVAGRENN